MICFNLSLEGFGNNDNNVVISNRRLIGGNVTVVLQPPEEGDVLCLKHRLQTQHTHARALSNRQTVSCWLFLSAEKC